MKIKLESFWDFLNRDIRSFFKKDYDFKFFRRDNRGKGVFEIKRYNKKTDEEIPYDFPVYLQTVPREFLLPKKTWLTSDDI